MTEQDVIHLLIEDHRRVDQLFEALGIAAGSRKERATELVNELRLHTTLEEELVYPAIRDVNPDGDSQVEEAMQEHDEVDKLLGRIEGMSTEGTEFDRLLVELQDKVRHHVEEEEDEVFPEFRQRAGEERLRDMGRKAMEMKQKKQRGQSQVAGRATSSMSDMTKQELYEKAKKAGIEGRSSMTKDELARALAKQR